MFRCHSAKPNLPKWTMRWWLYHVAVFLPVALANLGIFDTFSNQDLRGAVRRWNTDTKNLTLRYGQIHEWNVSQITNMSELFRDMTRFNENISNWDVSNVQDMSFMFYGAASFNVDIGAWNTSSVTDVKAMFYNAAAFNQDIGGWDMSSVKDMSGMFLGAASFNMHIGAWNTSSVRDVTTMFGNAAAFNQGHCRVGHVFSEQHEPNVLRSNFFQYAHWGLEYIQCHRCDGDVLQCCCLQSRHWRVGTCLQ